MATYRRWGAGPVGGGGVRGGGGGSYNVLGMFVPRPIAWLIAATVLTTALGALLQRNGLPILTYATLSPAFVRAGEVWRLFTWVLLEPNAIGLVFGCLLLYFIGPDLLARWGTRRFLLLYFGCAGVVGLVTCLLGFAWGAVYRSDYFGMWPMQEALIICWAAAMPDRRILAFFVLPLSGRNLILFTIAVTFVFALMGGFAPFVPHFLAELAALVYMDVLSFRRVYLRGRMAMLQRDYKRRTAHMRVVDKDDDKPPRWMH
jgi:membrane associated rhomboid family serine protease